MLTPSRTPAPTKPPTVVYVYKKSDLLYTFRRTCIGSAPELSTSAGQAGRSHAARWKSWRRACLAHLDAGGPGRSGGNRSVSVSGHLGAAAPQIRLRGKGPGAPPPTTWKCLIAGNAGAALLGVVTAQTSMPWPGFVDMGIDHLLWNVRGGAAGC